MSDLGLAQNHAFNLACTLMSGHALQVDGEYGVMPSDEIDEGDGLDIIHEYNPHDERPAH
ncbi:hypothetical protein NK6_b_213 (plasmid) [Bradyrhizobium diazoefficiens]|uniref:Uncharacterized protein n=1 Tax=Bradyrhizobium diazoefficiens TaxID=1355477 RepID=A0A0E4BYQ4_9BRAD|nr:hypothetical protein NK6_b_213 [Bradyrhizobium diazoefficiens]